MDALGLNGPGQAYGWLGGGEPARQHHDEDPTLAGEARSYGRALQVT